MIEIGRIKQRLFRGYSIVSMVGWIYLVIGLTREWFNLSNRLSIILGILGLFGFFFVGYAYDKLGFYSQEQKLMRAYDPVLMGFMKRIDSHLEKIEEMVR